jgi:hypothetical protein
MQTTRGEILTLAPLESGRSPASLENRRMMDLVEEKKEGEKEEKEEDKGER